jgi:hypothetical protein
LGHNVIDAGSNHLEGFIFFQPATLSGVGTVYSIYAYTGGFSGQVRVGLYNDNAGQPGGLLTQSDPTVVGNNTWQSIPVPGVALGPGTYYVAIQGNALAYLRFNSSSGSALYGNAAFGPLPGIAPSTTALNWDFDVYAALQCPGSTPTGTPTLTVSTTLSNTPSVTPTGTPTVTRSATPSPTNTITPTASPTATVTPPYTCLQIGDTNVEAGNSVFIGNGTFVAQSITVGTLSRLSSLSLYNTGGTATQLTMGLYKDNGSGRPGALVAQATSPGATGGWNTLTMTAVDVDPGIYWIAYLVGNSSMKPAYASVTYAWSASYGYFGYPTILPGNWTKTLAQYPYAFSLYATFCDNTAGIASTPTPTPPNFACGYVGNNYFINGSSFGARDMHAIKVSVTTDSVVDTMHINMGAGAGNLIVAIYSDAGAAPGYIITQSASTPAVQNGWNTISIPSTYLAPGNYWLACWAANTTFKLYKV